MLEKIYCIIRGKSLGERHSLLHQALLDSVFRDALKFV